MADSSWKVLEAIVPILKSFERATEALTREDSPTLSQVPVLVFSLYQKMQRVNEDDDDVAKMLKESLKTNLAKRFDLDQDGHFENPQSPVVIAAYLDPRYKSMKFLTHPVKEMVVNHVRTLIPTPNIAPRENDNKVDNDDILDCLEVDDDGEVMDEVEAYSREAANAKCNVLDWWRANEVRFPNLARIAKQILTIPATEVASERMFSSAGNVLTKLRSQLSDDTVDAIIFLHKNGKGSSKRRREDNGEEEPSTKRMCLSQY